MSRLSTRTLRMAAAATQAGIDSAVTIAARTPGLLAQGLSPTAAGMRETQRMIGEKLDAAYESAAAAQIAWTSLLLKAVCGRVRNAGDFSLGVAGVVEAAITPARRKARANARRLTGRRKIG